jgi:hypothetical protein
MDGETALPYDNLPDRGMTLRDWFAGQALNGLIIAEKRGEAYYEDGSLVNWKKVLSETAYLYADAMLVVRKP